MTQEGKDRIITRAIHFIATNTKKDSYRIGQAIIAELELVKKSTLGTLGVEGIGCPGVDGITDYGYGGVSND
jgi:hypothetical protein